MGKLKKVELNMSHLQHMSLSENGFVIDNYYDVNDSTDDDGTRTEFSFEELKLETLESAVIPKLDTDLAESIKDDNFEMPDNSTTQSILNDVIKLREFAENLEKSIRDSIKK